MIALEIDLRTKLSALERDSSNNTLAEEVAALARELEIASYKWAKMEETLRRFQDPELGGSCALPLPSQPEARVQR